MAISRFLVERWPDIRWFAFWFNGVPFENTYSPLLQVLDAVVAKVAHCSTALSFHAVIAFFYCLGPVLLFLFAWKASKLLHAGFLCGLMYSLFSPSVLLPAVRDDVGGWRNPRRLHTLVHYGEGAHNVVLSLLPLALLCAYFAITRRKFIWYAATGFFMGALVLTNAFAACGFGAWPPHHGRMSTHAAAVAQPDDLGTDRPGGISLDFAHPDARSGAHHPYRLPAGRRLPIHAARDIDRPWSAGRGLRRLVLHAKAIPLVRPVCDSVRIRLYSGGGIGAFSRKSRFCRSPNGTTWRWKWRFAWRSFSVRDMHCRPPDQGRTGRLRGPPRWRCCWCSWRGRPFRIVPSREA